MGARVSVQAQLPANIVEELNAQLNEYVAMHELQQAVQHQHGPGCTLHHGPSHSLAHETGQIPASAAAAAAASFASSAAGATAATSASSGDALVCGALAAPGVSPGGNGNLPGAAGEPTARGLSIDAVSAGGEDFPPLFSNPALPRVSPAEQNVLVRRFIRSMRRSESEIVRRAMEAIRRLPNAALMQSHGFLLLSWVAFGREKLLVDDEILSLLPVALQRFPFDRFLLASASSLVRPANARC